MARTRNNQMFALPGPPPQALTVRGESYRLVRVFKHDFWAATCLYEVSSSFQEDKLQEDNGEQQEAPLPSAPCPRSFRQIVVKFGRAHGFAGVPLRWTGEKLADHEQAIYHALAGVDGVPAWVGRIDDVTCAIEYIDATPLDHLDRSAIPDGLFERLRAIVDAIHARGVAYVDANKRSNILVRDDGTPVVIDYQISLRRRDDWPRPLRGLAAAVVRYLQGKDIYHLYKHKRRLRPDELTADEEALSRHRSGVHLLWRKITKPYRRLRRGFLRTQHEAGRLVSPTAKMENHDQPEKATWRSDGEDG
ncbi:MAG: hypothetical protein GVY16_02040 [Planctomycetes bacterium]|jgi:hypothetical protein|nr:hypothetical protein [Phycisphaerae bacterium]NBB94502.1 hypothetical protein [Planctomycetota bacterium]